MLINLANVNFTLNDIKLLRAYDMFGDCACLYRTKTNIAIMSLDRPDWNDERGDWDIPECSINVGNGHGHESKNAIMLVDLHIMRTCALKLISVAEATNV